MPNDERINNVENTVRALANELRAENPALAAHTELLAQNLGGLSAGPKQMKTSDFEISGENIGFPPEPELQHDEFSLQERIIGRGDFMPAHFLSKGADVQRSVARVVLTDFHQGFSPGTGFGTAFLIGRNLLMTNNHVIPNLATARKMRFQFNYQMAYDGIDLPTQSFTPNISGTFRTNADLDYSLIRLHDAQPQPGSSAAAQAGDTWGWVNLMPTQNYHDELRLNIIQHPQGRKKEVVLQSNLITDLFEHTVRYTADTEHGSSGSPVFDNMWRLVALHHSGGKIDDGVWKDNEGIRIDRIVQDLRDAFNAEPEVLAELGI